MRLAVQQRHGDAQRGVQSCQSVPQGDVGPHRGTVREAVQVPARALHTGFLQGPGLSVLCFLCAVGAVGGKHCWGQAHVQRADCSPSAWWPALVVSQQDANACQALHILSEV